MDFRLPPSGSDRTGRSRIGYCDAQEFPRLVRGEIVGRQQNCIAVDGQQARLVVQDDFDHGHRFAVSHLDDDARRAGRGTLAHSTDVLHPTVRGKRLKDFDGQLRIQQRQTGQSAVADHFGPHIGADPGGRLRDLNAFRAQYVVAIRRDLIAPAVPGIVGAAHRQRDQRQPDQRLPPGCTGQRNQLGDETRGAGTFFLLRGRIHRLCLLAPVRRVFAITRCRSRSADRHPAARIRAAVNNRSIPIHGRWSLPPR